MSLIQTWVADPSQSVDFQHPAGFKVLKSVNRLSHAGGIDCACLDMRPKSFAARESLNFSSSWSHLRKSFSGLTTGIPSPTNKSDDRNQGAMHLSLELVEVFCLRIVICATGAMDTPQIGERVTWLHRLAWSVHSVLLRSYIWSNFAFVKMSQ